MCPSNSLSRPPSTAATPNFRSAFDVIDADHDGKISVSDLTFFFKDFTASSSSSSSSESSSSDDMIDAMIQAADSNNSGFVEYEEFERVLQGYNGKSKSTGLMEDVFNVMDKDGDGRLSYDDLKSFMHLAGFSDVDDEEILAMITLAGGDLQNGLSFHGLLKVFGVLIF